MKTPTRAKIFLAPEEHVRPVALKEGQRRCPVCSKGVMPNKRGNIARHKDDADGTWCAGRIIRYGYVYRGTGVDSTDESA